MQHYLTQSSEVISMCWLIKLIYDFTVKLSLCQDWKLQNFPPKSWEFFKLIITSVLGCLTQGWCGFGNLLMACRVLSLPAFSANEVGC